VQAVRRYRFDGRRSRRALSACGAGLKLGIYN
jgi:hypothetical protein